MANQIQHSAAAALPAQQTSPSNDWATVDQIIPQLSANFALVRPVTMSEDAAAEWLAVAATELNGYRRDQIEQALSAARRECTHHGQILPFVFKWLDEAANRYSFTGRKQIPRRPQYDLAAMPSEVSGLIADATKGMRG